MSIRTSLNISQRRGPPWLISRAVKFSNPESLRAPALPTSDFRSSAPAARCREVGVCGMGAPRCRGRRHARRDHHDLSLVGNLHPVERPRTRLLPLRLGAPARRADSNVRLGSGATGPRPDEKPDASLLLLLPDPNSHWLTKKFIVPSISTTTARWHGCRDAFFLNFIQPRARYGLACLGIDSVKRARTARVRCASPPVADLRRSHMSPSCWPRRLVIDVSRTRLSRVILAVPRVWATVSRCHPGARHVPPLPNAPWRQS